MRLNLGQALLGSAGPRELAAIFARLGLGTDAFPEVAWLEGPDLRYQGTRLAHSVAQLTAMSEQELHDYRRSWSLATELAQRRLYPLQGDIRGYGDEAGRQSMLQGTRDLVAAKGRDDFLERAAARVEGGWLTLLFVPRGGQGATAYGIPVREVAGLSDAEFETWRKRFLRWVEIHVPGQSQVRKLATLSDADFEELLVAAREKHGAFDVNRALERFEQCTGISLRPPRFARRETAAVIERVATGSTAEAAGLRAGDRVLEVEGAAVPEWNDLVALLGAYSTGSVVRLVVARVGPPKLVACDWIVPSRAGS